MRSIGVGWALRGLATLGVLAGAACSAGPGPAIAPAAMLAPAPARGQDDGMVRVEAGLLLMGADEGPVDERPMHTVELPAFAIDRLPVTTTQFAAFLNAGGVRNDRGQDLFDDDDRDARIHRVGGQFVPDAGFESHPVVEATWFGARDYCAWRGARLPTEAEWERAARGTDARLYPWGAEPPDAGRARFGARYGDYGPVGSWPAGATP